jgi:hypothetical protein
VKRAAAALLLLALGACKPLPATKTAAAATATPGGERMRLGWITWNNADELMYCNRRIDDNGNPVGVLGPCWRLAAGEAAPHKMVSWLNIGRMDDKLPDVGPWPRCSVELEPAKLLPKAEPARAWLRSPSGRNVLDEWAPDAGVNGDAFVIELSFSPEGKWMAVAHLAIGLGEGERAVDFSSVTLRELPACR